MSWPWLDLAFFLVAWPHSFETVEFGPGDITLSVVPASANAINMNLAVATVINVQTRSIRTRPTTASCESAEFAHNLTCEQFNYG